MLTVKARKWGLAMACAMGITSFSGYVYAADEALPGREGAARSSASSSALAVHTLAGITIEGAQDVLPGGMLNTTGSIGLLGEQDVMDVPFTVTNVSREAIDLFSSPFAGISDALSLSPSVRADLGGTYTDISIRGIYQNGHAYYVNGIPGLLCMENVPFYWVESVSVISGPNIGVNGTGYSEAVAGSVNFKSKVASEEGNNEVKLTYRGGSSFEEGIDIGRRFGENNEFGVRVTANNINGETSIDGEKLEQQNLYVNLDHKSENSKTNLLIGYNHTDHEGGPYSFSFTSGAVTQLPNAPDSGRIYKPDWSYNEYDNWIVALNHEQKISEKVSAYLNAGYHREDWYGYIDGSTRVINNNGDFTVTLSNYPMSITKKYFGVGIKGKFAIGSVQNEYTIGVDKNWYTGHGGTDPNWSWVGTGNLYMPNQWTRPGWNDYTPPPSATAQMFGWHVLDTIKAIDDKLQITLGVHGHETKRTPAGSDEQKSDAICPTFAISYKFTPDFMIYADHTESFGYGSLVGSTYANAGELLDPAKTKQNELGIKFRTGKFYNTFNIFEIKQANTAETWENGELYLRLNGRQKNRGVEWGLSGNLARKWDVFGGLMYLDAKDDEGKRVNGAARWSGNLGAIYHPNDKVSLIGRMTYLGTSTINDGDLDVPSFVKFDLGVSYETQIASTPVTINAMCYNVGNKDYWQARSGYSSLVLGAPRTFVVSASFRL